MTAPMFTNALLVDLQERGFIHGVTKPQVLDNVMNAGAITVYAGFDCTADSLHVGNLLSLVLLKKFKDAGHRVIPLIGLATTLVGDPSGKDKARPMIDADVVTANSIGIMNNIRTILGDDVLILSNDEWLKGLRYIEFLRDIGTHIPVSKMLALDSVRTRLDKEEGMSFLEFNYSLLQAFDFLHLTEQFGTTLQVGGSDQWGNITMGCELIRRVHGLEAFGLTTPLLTNAQGDKMGKSVNGATWLSRNKLSDWDFWQFWRNVDDRDVAKCLRLFTTITPTTISSMENGDPNLMKKALASEVTTLVRGLDASQECERVAANLFQGGITPAMPFMAPKAIFRVGDDLSALLARTGKVESRSAGRRLIEGAGVKINDVVISDTQFTLTSDHDGNKLTMGKKNIFQLTLEA